MAACHDPHPPRSAYPAPTKFWGADLGQICKSEASVPTGDSHSSHAPNSLPRQDNPLADPYERFSKELVLALRGEPDQIQPVLPLDKPLFDTWINPF